MRTDVEIITVHYNTPDLLMKLYKSIRTHIGYDILFRVIDGSEIVHYDFIALEKQDSNFKFIRQGFNIHHGNGMNKAIETSNKDYILILDSDCEILKPGVLDEMFKLLDPDETYAVGKIYKMLPNGIHTDDMFDFLLYLHPKTMLLNRKMYYKYKPFKNHGSPCIYAMSHINDCHDYNILKQFNELDEYVFEKGRGTVERFGYGLRKVKGRDRGFQSTKTVFNILIRTSGRPNYFKSCIDSVLVQTYGNYRIIVSYDDQDTYEYVKKYKNITCVKVDRVDFLTNRKSMVDEFMNKKRLHAPYNLYFNQMIKYCDPGAYIIFLDDDNMFIDATALYKLYYTIKSSDDIVFWRMQFPNRLVPSDANFNSRPVCCDIDSGCFTFNIKHWIDWDEWTMGDYRIANLLFNRIKNRYYINKPLTGLQRQIANGLGRRDDK